MIYEGLRANLWMLWSYLLRSLGSFLFVVDTVLKVTLLTLYFVDPKTLRVPNEGLRSYLWRPLTLSLKAIGLIAVWTWRSFEVTVLNLYFFDPKTFITVSTSNKGRWPLQIRPKAFINKAEGFWINRNTVTSKTVSRSNKDKADDLHRFINKAEGLHK